jgi:hypothetical protein
MWRYLCSRPARCWVVAQCLSKRVIRPKIAYYAIQNVTSVFDHALERIVELEHTHNLGGASDNAHRYTHSTDRSLAVFGYSHKVTRKQVYTIWQRDSIPADANDLSLQEIAISKTSRCTTPRF